MKHNDNSILGKVLFLILTFALIQGVTNPMALYNTVSFVVDKKPLRSRLNQFTTSIEKGIGAFADFLLSPFRRRPATREVVVASKTDSIRLSGEGPLVNMALIQSPRAHIQPPETIPIPEEHSRPFTLEEPLVIDEEQRIDSEPSREPLVAADELVPLKEDEPLAAMPKDRAPTSDVAAQHREALRDAVRSTIQNAGQALREYRALQKATGGRDLPKFQRD